MVEDDEGVEGLSIVGLCLAVLITDRFVFQVIKKLPATRMLLMSRVTMAKCLTARQVLSGLDWNLMQPQILTLTLTTSMTSLASWFLPVNPIGSEYIILSLY